MRLASGGGADAEEIVAIRVLLAEVAVVVAVVVRVAAV